MEEVRIGVISNKEGFAELKQAWRNLAKESGASVFSSWEWLFTWWEYYGKSDRLFIIALYVKETLIALFPHLISKRKLLFGGAVNVIRIIGSDHVSSDYLDFIIDPHHTDAALNAWMDYLTTPGREWALMEITGITSETEVYDKIRDASRHSGLIVHQEMREVCPFCAIDPDGYADRIRHSRTLRRVLEYARALQRQHGYRFGTGLIGGDFEKTFDTFLALHDERSTQKERRTKFGRRLFFGAFSGTPRAGSPTPGTFSSPGLPSGTISWRFI